MLLYDGFGPLATQLEINEITSIYEDVLFRAPDPDGLSYWSGLLDSGAMSLTQITDALVASPEAQTLVYPIVRLYEGLFGRAPDFAGLQYWVALADAGTSFDGIVQGFVGSQEFANDYNGGVLGPIARADANAFVTALYENILGRSPDPAGLTDWLHTLGTPTVTSEAKVIEGIINSPEYITDSQNTVAAYEANGAAAGLVTTNSTWVGDVGVTDLFNIGSGAGDEIINFASGGSAASNSGGSLPIVVDTDPFVVPPDTDIAIAGADANVSLGANDTINLGITGASGGVNVSVAGDVTGATSAVITDNTLPDAMVHETINWQAGNLNLTFGNEPNEALAGGTWADSQVDVSAATSLGNALDIAAGQAAALDQNLAAGHNTTAPINGQLELNANTGLVDWFQYGGNTFIVEANNNTAAAAAHTALGTHDAVIELIGLVNPSEIGFNHIA
jgi:hypothetical protein